MKKQIIIVLALLASFALSAQDNKPVKGTMGIGYSIDFFPVQPSVSISGMVSNNVEIGGNVWVQFYRQRSSSYDSTNVNIGGTPTVILDGETETKTVSSNTTVGITPFFRYHFNIKNNLDLYTGIGVPIGITPTTKTVNSTIITADEYERTFSTTSTGPVGISYGGQVLLGCRWFFYKNLALGAETSLGVGGSTRKGNMKTVSAERNSGSNNSNTDPDDFTTEDKIRTGSTGVGLLTNVGLTLNWYFACNKTE